jgi:hypothetical protein
LRDDEKDRRAVRSRPLGDYDRRLYTLDDPPETEAGPEFRTQFGRYELIFQAQQQHPLRGEKYCASIPWSGKTLLILQVLGPLLEANRTTFEVRILRNPASITGATNMEDAAILRLPVKKMSEPIAFIEHDFAPGSYIAWIKVRNDQDSHEVIGQYVFKIGSAHGL